MKSKVEEVKALVMKAFRFQAKADNAILRTPEVMKVATFHLNESNDHLLQIRVCGTYIPPHLANTIVLNHLHPLCPVL